MLKGIKVCDDCVFSHQCDIVFYEDILRICVVNVAELPDIDIVPYVYASPSMHLDPPGIKGAEIGHPEKNDVPDLPAGKTEFAHLSPLAGVPYGFGKGGSVVEIGNLDGFGNVELSR